MAERRARPSKKKTLALQKRRRRIRSILFGSLAALLVAGGFYLATTYAEISALIEERHAALTSSILSAPHEIRVGENIERSQLVDRLSSLSYTQVPLVESSGQYSKSASEIQIYLRGFQIGASRHPASLVKVRLERTRIAAISDAAGLPVEHALLEPEAIGRLIPGAPAERIEIRLADQKPYLVDGLLATEDGYFYWHPGLNPVRILKAAIADIREGRLAQGASTLTQQLARTFLERRERSFGRKLRELAVALVIELRLSKDEILERYINDVSMGSYGGAPIHGMPQAARYLFNKDLSQVTPAEAATLIGMVQAPTLYDPRRYVDASTQRRNVVLAVMKKNGVIEEAAYASAVATPLVVGKARGLRRAPHFTDYVINALREIPGFDGDFAGLKVFTTLDSKLQRDAINATTANLEKVEKSRPSLKRAGDADKLETAAVVLDARSGAIRAMVGGRNYAASQFNRAAFALRQPGSAFKPIVYLAAMDPKRSPILPPLTLASLLPDQPMSFGGWTPENYEHNYESVVTAVGALSRSINIPAAFVGSRLGPELVVRTAHELGIPQDLEPLLTISVGAEETTLLDLTSSYQAFANAGTRHTPYAIEAVVDAGNHEIYRHESVPVRVMDPAVAYLMTGALKMVLKTGTGASAGRLGLDIPAAGKTGTTQDYKDSWFVGYTPELVCGVWLGFDSPQSTGLTGAQGALPPWVRIMQDSAAAQVQDFRVPQGIELAKIDPSSGGLATPSCPVQATLPFLAGTAPRDSCALHGGYAYASNAAASRNWGGWRSTTTYETRPASEPTEKKPNPFSKIGKFFGSIFRRH